MHVRTRIQSRDVMEIVLRLFATTSSSEAGSEGKPHENRPSEPHPRQLLPEFRLTARGPERLEPPHFRKTLLWSSSIPSIPSIQFLSGTPDLSSLSITLFLFIFYFLHLLWKSLTPLRANDSPLKPTKTHGRCLFFVCLFFFPFFELHTGAHCSLPLTHGFLPGFLPSVLCTPRSAAMELPSPHLRGFHLRKAQRT